MRSIVKQITWLCLLLMFLSAYTFAAHRHSSSLNEAQCTICVLAHSTSLVAASNLSRFVLVLIVLVGLAGPVAAKQRLVPFALTVRPPPGP